MKKINYAVVVSLLGLLVMPAVSQAQSIAGGMSATNQLQTLMAQLTALRAEVAAKTGGTVLGVRCFNLTAPLGQGSTGSAVTMLQTALKSDGLSVNTTGKFDAQTTVAVSQFQIEHASAILAPLKLAVPTGYVGKATIAQLNILHPCGAKPASLPGSAPTLVPVPTVSPAFVPGSASTSTTISPISAPRSLTISADPTEPAAGDVVMGSTGNTLSVLRFTETSNIESVKVTDLTITDTVASTATIKPTFSNLTAWNGSTLLGTAGAPTVRSATAYAYTMHFATPIIVPQGGSISITFKGDAASYASGAATDGSVHMFGITQPTDVTVYGVNSNRQVVAFINSAEGTQQTVLRTLLGMMAAPLGVQSGRSKSPTDDFGTVTATANPAGPAALNKISIEFSGTAATSSLFASNSNVSLIDQNGQNITTDGAIETIGSGGGGGSTNYNVTWTFPAGASGFIIANGSSYTFKLRINSSVIPAIPNVAETLSATVGYASDVSWTDGLDAEALSSLPLAPSNVPLVINSVVYAVGN